MSNPLTVLASMTTPETDAIALERRPADAGEFQADNMRGLKEALSLFYRRLARVMVDAPERLSESRRAILASIATDVESVHRRLDQLASGEPPGAPEEASLSPAPERKRPCVLLIDDDDSSCASLRELLEQSFDVLVATQGIEGARLLREKKPDAVITDLVMPDLDGFSLLTTARCDGDTRDIPLLVVSGMLEIDAKVRAFEAGAFDYLTKPVAPGEILARVRNAIARSEALRREQKLQSTDDLTGLANRRQLRTFLAAALRKAAREHSELSLVMVDQNGLKQVNDRYGHAAGDAAIQAVARALSRCRRGTDCAARTGGDEFVVVMPGADRIGAAGFIERVQEELARNPVLVAGGHPLVVTASFGIACCGDVAWEESVEQLLDRADQALYEAKRRTYAQHPLLAV